MKTKSALIKVHFSGVMNELIALLLITLEFIYIYVGLFLIGFEN